ncbi:MAG: hypothetical protein MUO70_03925 [Euryarchaeota archaeon]|nr:hypothetical protein [Euryarchaeota archaeon]
MIYGGTISTLANTLETAPQRTVVYVTLGLIYHLKVIFPPGPSGLLHVQVFDGTYQLFPTTVGQAFEGDNSRLEFDELYSKDEEPFQLTVVSWNLDDTYAHEAIVLISLATKEEYMARYLPGMSSDMLAQALAAGEMAKEAERGRRVKAFVESIPGEGG